MILLVTRRKRDYHVWMNMQETRMNIMAMIRIPMPMPKDMNMPSVEQGKKT